MRTKQMHENNIVVWFFGNTLLEVFMPAAVDDSRISDFLMSLLTEGRVKMVSLRGKISETYASQAVTCFEESKLEIQDRIVEFLNGLGYEAIEEEPE